MPTPPAYPAANAISMNAAERDGPPRTGRCPGVPEKTDPDNKTPGAHRTWRKDARAAQKPLSVSTREKMCSSKVKLTCCLAATRIEGKGAQQRACPAVPRCAAETQASPPMYMNMPRSRRPGRSMHTLRSPSQSLFMMSYPSLILFHAMQSLAGEVAMIPHPPPNQMAIITPPF